MSRYRHTRPMARLPEPVVQAMNAQGRSTVPVPRTGRISTSEVMQASVNPAGMPSTRKPNIKFRKCQEHQERISPQKPAGDFTDMEKYL